MTGPSLESAIADPTMPFLSMALDDDAVSPLLARAVGESGAARAIEVLASRVVRHKPGKRCLLEYDVTLQRENGTAEQATLVAKVRATASDRGTHRLMQHLRAAGCTEHGDAGFCVPEPLGLVPELHMWLQRKVRGIAATDLLATDFPPLAHRIARAIHELHHAGLPAGRTHRLADELAILQQRFTLLADQQPVLRPRLLRLLDRCCRLAANLGDTTPRGIHRDFYPDHVLVDGPRLYIIDFDLYCSGDPALDMGNFNAHITELALRRHGDAGAFAVHEAALEEAYAACASGAAVRRMRGFALLTLARHVSLSTQFADRQHTTGALLELCEERLHLMHVS